MNKQLMHPASIAAKIQRIGYPYAQVEGRTANILMPLQHAKLAEEISDRLAMPSQVMPESRWDARLLIRAGDERLLLEMLAAVKFLFCATDPGKSTAEPMLIEKPTGFFIYQMERSSNIIGRTGAQHLIILPGGRIPLHYHEQCNEVFRPVDAVTFHLDGKLVQLPKNSRITVPMGSIHGTAPHSGGFIRMIAAKSPMVDGDYRPAE
ncbi:MAG: hypothetical protein WC861_01615 [Candidatus Micrarchaeia archaeon]